MDLVISAANKQIIKIKEQLCHKLGYETKSLENKPVDTLFAKPISLPSRAYEGKLINNVFLQKNGEPLPVKLFIFYDGHPPANIQFHVLTYETDRSVRRNRDVEDEKFYAMKSLLGMGSFGIWDWNILKDDLVWDERMYELYGRKPTEFKNTFDAWIQFIHPDDSLITKSSIETALDGGAPFNTVFRINWPNEESRYIRAMANVTLNAENKPIRMTGINWDVTVDQKIKLVSHEISQIQQHFLSGTSQQKLFDLCIEKLGKISESEYGLFGLVATDKKGAQYLKVFSFYGLPKTKRIESQISEDRVDGAIEFHNLHSVLGQPIITGEHYISNDLKNDPHAIGFPQWYPTIENYLGVPIYGPEGLIAMYGVANRKCGYNEEFYQLLKPVSDCISGIISANKSFKIIENLAQKDSLTQLYNRNYFESVFDSILASHQEHNKKLALLLIDLNLFKKINDIHGHDVGDSLLRQFSERLKSLCGENQIVARVGGDEFIVIAKNLSDYLEARELATRIQAKSQEPYLINGKKLLCACSIGISTYPRSGDTRMSLMKNADFALYEAKRTDHKIQYFTNELEKQYLDYYTIENELKKDFYDGKIYFDYQPIVSLVDKSIVGVEALARWHNERLGGMVSPELFVNTLEEMGLVKEFNLYVVDTVIKAFKSIYTKNGFKLSLNISPRIHNFDRHIVAVMQRIYQSHLTDRYNFSIEMTESGLMESEASADSNLLNQLWMDAKAKGIQLAIDDFGTESSSPLRFVENEFGILKIDKAFVQQIGEKSNPRYEAFIKSILSMCNDLSIDVIAEGIENKMQEQTLRNYGCQYAQGFAYYRPLSLEALKEEIEAQSK